MKKIQFIVLFYDDVMLYGNTVFRDGARLRSQFHNE